VNKAKSLLCCQAISLVGEYNNWDPQPEHWAVRNEFGVWELFLPDSEDGQQAIPHRHA
jgi:1,4-alpha-glucan branching enzyme